MSTVEEREAYLKEVHYNVFGLHADHVLIRQWAGIQMGDESYAGSPSFYRFEAALRELVPFKHIIPTHQGSVRPRLQEVEGDAVKGAAGHQDEG